MGIIGVCVTTTDSESAAQGCIQWGHWILIVVGTTGVCKTIYWQCGH